MLFGEYQRLSARTLKPGRTLAVDLQDYSLGLLTEAGEAFDVLKKHLYHGHALNVPALSKECGDQFWYAAALCTVLGLDMAEALKKSFIPEDQPLTSYPPRYFWAAAQISNQVESFAASGDESMLEGAIYHLGDCIAVVMLVLRRFNIDVGVVLADNVEKLKIRYPEGYSDVASIYRSL